MSIDEMMAKYNALQEYAEASPKRECNILDWISDVLHHQPAHCVGIASTDELACIFGKSACFLRLNEDTDGIGLLICMHSNFNLLTNKENPDFRWYAINLVDERNAEIRDVVARMFSESIPDHYGKDLHIVNAF